MIRFVRPVEQVNSLGKVPVALDAVAEQVAGSREAGSVTMEGVGKKDWKVKWRVEGVRVKEEMW